MGGYRLQEEEEEEEVAKMDLLYGAPIYLARKEKR